MGKKRKKYNKPEMRDVDMWDVPPKVNCYDCGWRRGMSGSAHSKCRHPEVAKSPVGASPLGAIFAIMNSGNKQGGGPVLALDAMEKMGVTAHEHGVMSGWFHWPWNFDPVWLVTCLGFTPKRKVCEVCEASLLCAAGLAGDGKVWETDGDGVAVSEKKRVVLPECWKTHGYERD